MLNPGPEIYRLTSRTIVLLFLLSLCRLLFWIINFNYFSNPGFMLFVQGIRFDLIAVIFGLAPYYIFLDNPFNFEKVKWVRRISQAYLIAVMCLYLLVNCIDMIYFKFTFKRSTWDLFSYVATGDDVISLIPQFFWDYWYIVLLFVALVWLGKFLLKLVDRIKFNASSSTAVRVIYNLLFIGLLFLGARGGIQLKPLNIIAASRYVDVQDIPLLLSTPFTMIKTVLKEQIEVRHYFESDREMKKYFNPVVEIDFDSVVKKKNVVVIIMESMSKEYIGYFNNGNGYTPFLDSLIGESMVFENAYANGKRSIEALPAIFSSLPNLMNEAYITSPYSGNKITSLAKELKKHGYTSSFFHGGKNGTMGFDSYVNFTGFDSYFGLDEYPDKADFDGSWGVYDMPYFQYFGKMQGEMKEPFLSCIFSLSAHHPYSLPASFDKTLCPEGELRIHRTICYADHALKEYFKKVRNSDWFSNSIFLITADHTAQNSVPEYDNFMGNYSIPMILFDPVKRKHTEIKNVTQQADIFPTILDYVGLSAKFKAYGQSALNSGDDAFAINYLGGVYQYIDNRFAIYFDGNEIISAIDFKSPDKKPEYDAYKSSLFKMKAIIQTYNNSLINNQMSLDE